VIVEKGLRKGRGKSIRSAFQGKKWREMAASMVLRKKSYSGKRVQPKETKTRKASKRRLREEEGAVSAEGARDGHLIRGDEGKI